MSKLSKLVQNPKKFLVDSKFISYFSIDDFKSVFEQVGIEKNDNSKIAICIGFNPWKREFFSEYIDVYSTYFVRGKTAPNKIIKALKTINQEYDVFIWSYTEHPKVYEYLSKNRIDISRVEDGFIRSIGLGAHKVKPLSLVFDTDGLYFNPHTESKLEMIIKNKACLYGNEEKQTAKKLIAKITHNDISKYNYLESIESDISLDSNIENNILVIGQVEDDKSLLYGTSEVKTNLELLKIAYNEHPDKNIIFKAHPDIFLAKRKSLNNIDEFKQYATVIENEFSLVECIKAVKHVYTLTSLGGFEALIRNKKVTCLGAPFYSGYGLTDDRCCLVEHRKKVFLDLESLVYASLVEYPTYLLKTVDNTIEAILDRKHSYLLDNQTNFSMFQASANIIQDIDNIKKFVEKKKIALITDSSDINNLYLFLNNYVETLNVLPMSFNVEKIIREKKIINPLKCRYISRAYFEPLGEIEKSSVNTSKIISNVYKNVLNRTLKGISSQSEQLSKIFSESFEDNIFNKSVVLHSIEQMYEENDIIIFYLNEKENFDLVNLIIYLYQKPVCVIFKNESKLEQYKSFIKEQKYTFNSSLPTLEKVNTELRKEFFSHYSQEDNFDSYDTLVCSNLLNRNYAYYPSGKEVLELVKKFNKSVLFLPDNLLSVNNYDSIKNILYEDFNGSLVYKVYPLVESYMKNNNILFVNLRSIFRNYEEFIINELKCVLPNQLVDYFSNDIKKFIDKIIIYFIFYLKMRVQLNNVDTFITTMERSIFSRIANIVMKEMNKENFGIQGVFISTSLRLHSPIVDKMSVVDTLQENNFLFKGYPKDRLFKTGSANLRNSINAIKAAPLDFKSDKKVILFIMQHSMSKVMIESIKILQQLDDNYTILIKPHPVQEPVVLEEVSKIICENKNISLLDKSENTYYYIKNSDIVVGLYSNVLYESMLCDIDTIVLKMDELNESVDFTQFGTFGSCSDLKELVNVINAFCNNDLYALDIRKQREKYINENSYIFTQNELISFLKLKKEKNV